MMEQIETLLKRPALYCNIDGVSELGIGIMCLGFFVLMWMQAHSSAPSFWLNPWIFTGFTALISALLYFGMKLLKERITYPRSGFVAYRKSKLVWAAAVAFAISCAGAITIFYMVRTQANSLMAIFLVGSLSLTALYAYRMAMAVHWKWIVVAAMTCAAVITAFLPNAFLRSLGGSAAKAGIAGLFGAILLFELCLSVMLLISGGISFFLYVRHVPLPKPETE